MSKGVKLSVGEEAINFRVGDAICGFFGTPVAECEICRALPPPRSTMVITKVDHKLGVITFALEDTE